MRLRTDDDIHRARHVYLGPPGYTLPIQLTYAQWGVGLLLAAVLSGGLWLCSADVALSIGLGVGAAIFLTVWVFQHVNPDRPARKVVRTALTDWRRVAPQPEKQLPALTAGHIKIGGRR